MHDFHYLNGELACERLPVRRVVEQVGTPVYLYSAKTLRDHYRKLAHAFRSVRPLICFSVKANGNLAILRLLVKAGAGLDVVSGGELFKALRAGCPPQRIVFASVGKTATEIAEALRAGIASFNVESLPELDVINAQAARLRKIARVAIRVNPDVAAQTHRHITTGTYESKFGIDLDTAAAVFKRHEAWPSVRLGGVHVHIGSQITEARPFIAALRKVRGLVAYAKRSGAPLSSINIGGGLGIVYKEERPQTADDFARAILPELRRLALSQVILEPGRFIVGNAGILITQVLYVKTTPRRRFVVVDAGMNDLIRPALYDAYHDVLPVVQPSETNHREPVDVVGPVCESADCFAKQRPLPHLSSGHLIAIMGAGAYGFTMASNYNARPRPCEVLVMGDRFHLIRRRETRNDLIRHDRIPSVLR